MNEQQLNSLFHDLKNDFASISALANLHKFYKEEMDSEELLTRLQERQMVIPVAYEMLYRQKSYPDLNIKSFIGELLTRERQHLSVSCPGVNISSRIDDASLPLKKALPAAQIVVELLTNSHRHAFKDLQTGREISLEITAEDSLLKLEYSDNGCGFEENFVPEKAKTLGMQLIKSLSRQLGGKPVFTGDGSGIRFSMDVKI